ncbi:MAG: bifunctional phosphoribosylaminoimidazolecarboxamide formyltransferase/IMP cyclohydrolase [Candidatus Tantalella remota]|nr:bifunctional phosphoribosylaminoimidazolecarboxamide formyltransferase/IMP cyclohydrolase [Candidatus Tantalella remota]
MKVKRALISVWDKTGLEEFVKGLDNLGVHILSTGGTAKKISSLGIKVTDVSDYTGSPEMLDGRVKTLHPKIHAGLLALRGNKEHMECLHKNGIHPIDMVVVNLYPFEETISRPDVTFEEAIENIDIGGPTMLRSAAKNFRSVAVLSSADQYEEVMEELQETGGELSEVTLKSLAADVFARTSGYDVLIAKYLADDPRDEKQEDDLPETITVALEKDKQLRYGENPHQRGAFYRDAGCPGEGVADIEQLQGKELSFNNILDLASALEMVRECDSPAVSIVKHNNPCGAATADTLGKAYVDALDCDRMSAFGSIMGFNGPVDKALAELILREVDFVECIIAPEYGDGALDVFGVKKNLRILKLPFASETLAKRLDIKKVPGGALVQDTDGNKLISGDLKVVTEKKPSKELLDSLMFGWKIVRFVKSNAIVLCQGTSTVGIGAGQMSRVDSVVIAVRKAAEKAKGAVLASDAFFPKADSIEEAHKAGISAIVQPGGSIRDEEVIEACNRLGIPMVFTGVRHFRH